MLLSAFKDDVIAVKYPTTHKRFSFKRKNIANAVFFPVRCPPGAVKSASRFIDPNPNALWVKHGGQEERLRFVYRCLVVKTAHVSQNSV